MTVNTTWVNPTGATLDLSNGTVVTETNWDAVASDLNRLGGSDGDTKTGPYRLGTTSNVNNTAGLTIDGVGSNIEYLTLQDSSQIAHGMTNITETESFARFTKQSATAGGVNLEGITETNLGVAVTGTVTTADTTKATTSVAAVYVQARLKSGTGAATMGANANVASFSDNGTVRHILDSDGDSHQDVGTAWTNFDAYDDAALLNALAHEVARPDDPIREEFRGWLDYNREALAASKVVTFNADGHHFVNMSKLTMLLVGAVRQQGLALREMERRLLPAG